MDCRRCLELAKDYLDGAVSPADRCAFEAHLGSCTSCRARIEADRALMDVVRKATDARMPAAARIRLRRALAKKKKS